jgi:hypothetical protein
MIAGVDCAFPHDEYPSWAKVVCGYAGGHTAHIWTASEVAKVRESGRLWWAIWTALNKSGTLNATLGHQDAAAMINRLPYYSYSKNDPVFYDVEPAIYDRDPAGARACISAWKQDMHTAGYGKAFVYTVKRQNGDWIAEWTNIRPSSIPTGKIGIQYGGDLGGFDYDVFADELIGETMSLTPDELKLLQGAYDRTGLILRGDDPNPPTGDTHPNNLENLFKKVAMKTDLVAMQNDIAAIKELLAGLSSPTVAGTFTIQGSGSVSTG